ncbi:MT-A70 family methyltransferase [Streptomyces rochei]|uniref:MT-A70 family methyltransferase n=1 Tax=Streptomyces rochei TaxID=1928 RepID=UPI00341C87EE
MSDHSQPTTATDSPPLPEGRFGTIVADPPWTYTFSTRKTEAAGTGWHGSAQRHYSTMTFEEICALPIADMAADDCVLWLWAVNPMIHKGLELVTRWGFEYRGLLTWAKTTKDGRKPAFGSGYWLRGATEQVILATRGKPAHVRNQVTWFSAPVGAHSAKPAAAYQIFETFSDGPRVDLFARQTRPGWTTWGNDVQEAPLSLFDGIPTP